MPGFVFASVILASGVLQAQKANVSIQIRGAAAPVVVEQIAKETGLKLGADRNMWRDYLVVAVKDVTPEELLKRVAAACQGRWSMIDGVNTLMPDFDVRQRAVSAGLAQRTAGYAKSIKTFIDSLDPKPPQKGATPPETQPTTPGDDEAMDEPMYGPAGSGRRLLAAYVSALGPAYFARLDREARIVMSSSPTRMQAQLPNVNATPFLAKWITEHNDMVKAMARAGAEGEGESEVTNAEQEEMLKVMQELGITRPDMNDKPKAIEAMPAKLLFVVTSQSYFGGVASCTAELRAYDRAGKMILNEQNSLSEIDYAGMQEALAASGVAMEATVAAGPDGKAQEPPKPPTKPEPQTPLVLGEAGKLWAKVHKRSFNPAAKDESSKPTEDELLKVGDFVTNEPLAGAPTDYFLAMSAQNNVNVVASLPDEILQRGGFSVPADRLTMENTSRLLFGDPKTPMANSVMTLTKDGGWWTATPAEPEWARKRRLDRVAVTKVVKNFRATKWMNLDAMAEFVASVPEESSSTLQEWTRPMIDSQAFGGIFGGMGAENEWMRIWGMLDPGSRGALRRGVDVGFAGIPESARKEIAKKVFGPRAFLAPFPKPKGENELQIMNSLTLGMANGFETSGDLADEPTEALPTGLDMRGRLASSSFQEDYVLLSGVDTGFIESAALGLEEYAFFDIISHMPGVGPEADMLAGAKLRSGKRTSMRLRAEVVPNKGFQGLLTDPEKPTNAEFTLANMPADMKAAMERKKELIKASPLMKLIGFGIGRMGQQGEAPPPAR